MCKYECVRERGGHARKRERAREREIILKGGDGVYVVERGDWEEPEM
jgi:hypothetical protein